MNLILALIPLRKVCAVFKTAYFLLAVSYKDFASGADADIFTPDERSWYDEYVRQSD